MHPIEKSLEMLAGSSAPAPPVSQVDLLHGFEPEDVGNAQRIVNLQGERLRFCHAFEKWLVWDGRRWRIDETGKAELLAQQTMREFATQAVQANDPNLKFAVKSLQYSRISHALKMAEPRLPVLSSELDTHPDLLNFLNGTMNLRTGEFLPHSREHFITKLVQHEYQPEAKCPTFLSFLEKIMGYESDASEPDPRCDRLVEYLQRAFGYSLTGHTVEKAVFLLYGVGDNGKSTLLSTFLKLLEEYAVLLQIDTLMARPQESNNAQADLADLRDARFVMTSETEEGQRLAEGKLKRITQGMGKIKAVRKYENPIEFTESHKLWIDANHLPTVRGTDNAIWNRLHPVPFSVTIPKDEQDIELHSKLVAEGAGILAWAVAGSAKWYKSGLSTPQEVAKESNAWRTESDQVGRFIAECCIAVENAEAKARPLYVTYRKWAEDAGERAMRETDFGNSLKERGFMRTHRKTGSVYLGLGLMAKEGDVPF
jgi:putative DNA primase/helicase